MTGLPQTEILLQVDGTAYFGWTQIEVTRSIEAMAGSFDLELAAKERTALPDWPLEDGAECTVTLGGRTLITGFIDTIERSVDRESRALIVRGRDRTADLVDCSAVHSPGSWRGKSIDAIASELAAPFGISVSVEGEVGKPFTKFALQQGETVFESIERMARYRGLVAFSRGDGKLIIGSPDSGQSTGSLVEGENVLSATARRRMDERFSTITVKGQASGSDERSGAAVAQVSAEARDTQIARHRPLVLVGEEQSDRAALQKRADWEAAVRRGRARPATISAQGWFATAAEPWTPGRRCPVDVPSVKLAGELLIESVTFSSSGEQGTITELDLVPPEAWTQLAEAEPQS